MKKCTMCGKHFDVLWPEIWAYKRGMGTGTTFFLQLGMPEKIRQGKRKRSGRKNGSADGRTEKESGLYGI